MASKYNIHEINGNINYFCTMDDDGDKIYKKKLNHNC